MVRNQYEVRFKCKECGEVIKKYYVYDKKREYLEDNAPKCCGGRTKYLPASKQKCY